MTRARQLISQVLVAGIMLVGCSTDTSLHGLTRATPLTVGDVTMTDVTAPASRGGGRVAENMLRFQAAPQRFLAVYFGFLQCPDICPTTLMDLRVALDRVDADVKNAVDVVFVTVDPERDTPEALAAYLPHFFPRFHALRDDEAALGRVLDAFLASAEVQRDDNGDVVDVAHTAVLYLVNDAGDVVVEWPFGTRAQMIAEDLDALAAMYLTER